MDIIKLSKKHPKIYHYTDIKGLLGILDEEHLWASRFDFLNDTQEFKYGMRIITEILIKNLNNNSPGYIAKAFSNILYQELSKEFYVVSFCSHRGNFEHKRYTQRNGLLSMWRGYGENCGFAIALNTRELYKEAKKAFKIQPILEEVQYIQNGKSNQKKVAFGLLNEFNNIRNAFNYFKRNCDSNKIVIFRDYVKRREEELFKSLVSIICRIKNYGFHEENEIRMTVIDKPYDSSNKISAINDVDPVQYRSHKDCKLIPYIKFDLNNKLIKAIIVGPGKNQKDNVKSLLKKIQGKEKLQRIEVTASDIPFKHQ